MSIQCKGCDKVDSIVMIDLMIRLIGVDEEGNAAPEKRDTDEYECSTTVGYGCTNEDCPFWLGQYGNVNLGGSFGLITVDPGETFERICQSVTITDLCQDCWQRAEPDQYLPDEPSDEYGSCDECYETGLVYPFVNVEVTA